MFFRDLPSQLRAARALLNWTQADLAAAANMHTDAINRIEKGINHPQKASLEAIVSALSDHNVVITEDGVRMRRDAFREISPPDAYMKLLDDAFMTLKDTSGEVLFFYVDNELSSQAVIDSAIRMRRNGIHFRSLINEAKPYCLFPLKEYRVISPTLFHNNPILVYADKVGVVIETPDHANDTRSCYIIRNASYANAMRLMFDALWLSHKMPKQTTAKVTYD